MINFIRNVIGGLICIIGLWVAYLGYVIMPKELRLKLAEEVYKVFTENVK